MPHSLPLFQERYRDSIAQLTISNEELDYESR